MNIATLIKNLEDLGVEVGMDAEVVFSRDPEGNGFNALGKTLGYSRGLVVREGYRARLVESTDTKNALVLWADEEIDPEF